MTILITRPSPYGEQLTQQLNFIGKTAWHLPIISFSAGKELFLLKKQLQTLSKNDILIVMSQTAIKYAHYWLTQINTTWPKEICYYAIGRTTAFQTYQFTKLPILHPEVRETSEELLQLLKVTNNTLKGKQALILSGNKKRTLLQKILQTKGVQIKNCQAYSQIPIKYNGEEKTKYMLKIGINTIVITSKEILKHLYNLIPNDYRQKWLIKCKIIVVSHRLAIYAQELGWKNISVTEVVNNENLKNILINI